MTAMSKSVSWFWVSDEWLYMISGNMHSIHGSAYEIIYYMPTFITSHTPAEGVAASCLVSISPPRITFSLAHFKRPSIHNWSTCEEEVHMKTFIPKFVAYCARVNKIKTLKNDVIRFLLLVWNIKTNCVNLHLDLTSFTYMVLLSPVMSHSRHSRN